MAIALAVKRYLDDHGISYSTIHHERTETLQETASILGIDEQQIARSVLLRDSIGCVMAVLPATHRLDFRLLKKLLQRDLQIVQSHEADQIFIDCEPGSRPPVAEAYGFACIVDSSLSYFDNIYFEPGVHNTLVFMSSENFGEMLTSSLQGRFSYLVHQYC